MNLLLGPNGSGKTSVLEALYLLGAGKSFRFGGHEAVMSGDLMHHALQCAEPDWSSCFCVDPAHSARTRREFLGRYEGTPVRIFTAHFPTPTAGTIVRVGDAWRFKFEGE